MTASIEWLADGAARTELQMIVRAGVGFVGLILLLRIAGARGFSRRSPVGVAHAVIVGVLLALGIAGITPWMATWAAALTWVVSDRVVSSLAQRSPRFARWFRGTPIEVYRSGIFDRAAMRRAGVCEDEIAEAVRLHAHADSAWLARAIVVEPGGEVAVLHGTAARRG